MSAVPLDAKARAPIRRAPRERCPACGGAGRLHHAGLRDRWFGIADEWGMRACTASECGVWYLDPVPHPDDVARLYERYYTHASPGGPPDLLGRGWPRQARLAHLARRYGYRSEPALPTWSGWLLGLVPGRREHLDWSVLELRAEWRGPLLDVGCGSGGSLRLLGELGWDAEGIDLDPQAVEAANAAGLRARVGTFESVTLPERHYAAVTSVHVLEHVADPAAFLRDCLRVTRPHGRLALTTPNAASLGARVFGPRWRGLEPPRHFQVFTARGLARLAREAGYEAVEVRTSARLAAAIVRETLSPGLAVGGEGRVASPPLRLAASAFQIAERALLKLWPEAGEELLLCARAPGFRT